MARRRFTNIARGLISVLARDYSANVDEVAAKTCGIIVIGDEILKGDVADTNSRFMTAKLHNLGVKVKKISIIGDSVDEIATEVRQFSEGYNYVITTGGIGPTHDDVTYEGISKAFNEPLYAHPELLEICGKFYNTSDLKAAGMKMAYVPKSTLLIYGINKATGEKMKYPVVCVHNVYAFPGIPHLFEIAFENMHQILFTSRCKFYTRCVHVNLAEYQIAEALEKVVKKYSDVCVGSYPSYSQGQYIVRITIESINKTTTENAYNSLLEMIPAAALITHNEH